MSLQPQGTKTRAQRQTGRSRMVVSDLEVVTVTPTSAVITWITRGSWLGGVPHPVTAGTELLLGPTDGALRLVHDDPTPRAFHVVEVSGLEPGCRYRFRASSDGHPARAGLRTTRRSGCAEQTLEFTTLTPPPGSYLTTIALVNDIHIGEKRQGIVLGPLPTSVRPHPEQVDYPELMTAATLHDLVTRRGRPLLVVNGDLTYGNRTDEVLRARSLLDGYGLAGTDWVATRGNHDHPRTGDDPFAEHFVAYQQAQTVHDTSGLRIVAMDSTRGSGGGWITPDQYSQVMT
ncbi:MAG: metallophosphoesterase, partial [Brooklawnia sp.]